jgi:ribosomal protein L37E
MKKVYLEANLCTRCGYKWLSRFQKKPKTCASCNSPYWEKKRLKK